MDDQALLRYSRHILLDDIDIAGQSKLLQSRALIVGVGGLGSPAALYLAASGVGHLTLVDPDTVELSNLQRQIAHTEDAIGQPKSESARTRLQQLNSTLQVQALNSALTGDALQQAVATSDVVLDCTDNLDARFALNAACVKAGKPLVSGAAIRWEAQIALFHPAAGGACYQCLYKPGHHTATRCAEAGVAAPLVGIIGAMQALEAIKVLANAGQPLINRLLLLDAKSLQWREMQLKPDPRCEACSNLPANGAE